MKKQLLKAPGPASALVNPCQLTLALAVITILGLMVFSQALEDQYGQRVESWQDGDKLIYNIYSPHVKEAVTEFRNIRSIRIYAGWLNRASYPLAANLRCSLPCFLGSLFPTMVAISVIRLR